MEDLNQEKTITVSPAPVTTSKKRDMSLTSRICHLLAAEPKREFDITTAASLLGNTNATRVRTTFARLSKEGRVVRAERGRYRAAAPSQEIAIMADDVPADHHHQEDAAEQSGGGE